MSHPGSRLRASRSRTIAWLLLAASLAVIPACGGKPDVVIYVSLDQVFSESFLEEFEKDTGLRVRANYDVEAVKTVGLVNRIVEEKGHPRADVFWNNELANTVKLKELGLVEPYASPNAATIPAQYKDPEGYWTGFAARARVLIVNTDLVPEGEMPDSLYDLLDPRWKGKCGIAKPLAGTTLTHFTALWLRLGPEKFQEFLAGLRENDVHVATGNAHIMRLVSRGELHFGFTDTDDFHVALTDGKPVRAVYPDQGEDEMGTMVIPNSVIRIQGGPNPENAKTLIDYILRKETERKLAFSRSAQIPLHPGVEKPDHVRSPDEFKVMEVDFVEVGKRIDEATEILAAEFQR